MMHLYSILLCIAVHPKCFTIIWGISPQPPPVYSIHLDDATAATGQRCQCAHHTPATGREERETEPIQWMGIIRRPYLIWASGGNLARTPVLHPYSLREVPRDFFKDHRESGPRFNVSSERRCFLQYSAPSLYWGVRTQTNHRVSETCWTQKVSHTGTDQAQPCLASVSNQSWAAGYTDYE